jgi:CRISPR-associated protein Csx3
MFTTRVTEQYTLVEFTIPGNVLEPDDLINLHPPKVDGTKGVIISGRGPMWLYGYLCHTYHPTAWVGFFDPRLAGAVVVQSHQPGIQVGQVIPV